MPDGSTPSVEIPMNSVTRWVFRVIAWALAFTGFVLSAVTVGSCRFFKIEEIDPDNIFSISLKGLFNFIAQNGVCISIDLYLDTQDTTKEDAYKLDKSYKAARVFGVVAAVVGGVVMFVLLLQVICRIGKYLWLSMGVLLIMCVVFQGMTFVIFNTDECESFTETVDEEVRKTSKSCSIDDGGSTAIAAMCLYLMAAIAVFRTPFPDAPLFKFGNTENAEVPGVQPVEAQEERAPQANRTVTESINPDGTKTTFITTTVPCAPDGLETEEGAEV